MRLPGRESDAGPDDRGDDEDARAEAAESKRDPYDARTWGAECGRGVRYQDLGVMLPGQAAVRKMGGGRKHRGSASADYEKSGGKGVE